MRIETERLIIRDFTGEDINLIFDINNHPECIRFNGWNSMTIEKCQETLDIWIDNYAIMPGTGAFCIEDKTDKLKIGMAFIVKWEVLNQYEIGLLY